jgi:uncharacterized protein
MMPSCQDIGEIRIDKDGLWYFRGEEMKRLEIVTHLYNYLKRDEQGHYLIEIGNDKCYVNVEDAPYVIKSIGIEYFGTAGLPVIELSLSDGIKETLVSDTCMWVGEGNVLYCRVKKGTHHARFSRSAYYQICKYIEYDEGSESYSIKLAESSNPLVIRLLNINGGPHVR